MEGAPGPQRPAAEREAAELPATRPAPAARPAPASLPAPVLARRAPQPFGIVALTPTEADALEAPAPAARRVLHGIGDRVAQLPPAPDTPALAREPALPLLLLVVLVVFVAVTGRGDRRDPKLASAELDGRRQEVGFS